MFNNKHFYHEHIRKAIISFGTIFNNIYIHRKNSAGELVQSMKVPLSYAPKQKVLSRVKEVANLEEGRAKAEITLPRMAFEITSLVYDPSRKLVPMQTTRSIDTTASNGIKFAYVSTPYNMGVNMSIFAKNQDDGLQILEQIIPYFSPDFNITIKELPDLGVKRDIQFVLDGVTYNDDYAGDFSERTTITWDLTFTIKMNFYGYVQHAEVIKKVIENIYLDYYLTPDEAPTNSLVGRKITTEPTPTDADPSGDYSYIQEFDDIFNG